MNWDDHPRGLSPHHLPGNSSKYGGNLKQSPRFLFSLRFHWFDSLRLKLNQKNTRISKTIAVYISPWKLTIPSGNAMQTKEKHIFNKLTFQLTWQDPGSHGRLDVRGEKQPHGPTAVEAWTKFWIGWLERSVGFQWMDLSLKGNASVTKHFRYLKWSWRNPHL